MNIVTRLIRAYQAHRDYERYEQMMWRDAIEQKRLPDTDLLSRGKRSSFLRGILSPQEYKAYSIGRLIQGTLWGTNEHYEDNILLDCIKSLKTLAASEDLILHMDTFIEEMYRLQSQIEIILSYTKDYDDRKQCMKLVYQCREIYSSVEKKASNIRWSIFDRTNTLLENKCPYDDVLTAVQDFEELLQLKDLNLGTHKGKLRDYLSPSQEIYIIRDFCFQVTSFQEAVKLLNDFILPLRTDEVQLFSRVELIFLQRILTSIRELQCL